MYIDCYYFACTFDNKVQNNLVDCFSEKLNENEIEDNYNEINDRRGTEEQTFIRKKETRENNKRINGIKRGNNENGNTRTKTSTTNRRETNIFEPRFFTSDRAKQSVIRRIQSYDKR